MTDDDDPPMAELLPGRVPHYLEELHVTVYVDPPLSMEVAEHEARHAKKHGCTCLTIVYTADTMIEEDRVYRLMRAFHEADCLYTLRI